jgi:hypothetical protein
MQKLININLILIKILDYLKYKYFYYIYLKKISNKVIISNQKKFITRRFKDNSYNSYLKHQAFKYFLLKNRLNTNFDFQTKYFKKTFKKLKFLKGNILCLGARTGAEVKSLRDLGYFAIGIDLEYPKKSP